MTISTDNLYKAYLAYFGRPPDPTGLAGFANATQEQVIAAFSGSQESQDLFRSVSLPDQVSSIYRNLFGRPAEALGQAYWVGEIQAGRVSLAGAAFAILGGALNNDAVVVETKLDVMRTFVQQVESDPTLRAGYTGNAAALAARNFLATVAGDNAAALQTSRASALAALPTAVQQVAAAGVASGATTPGATTPGTTTPGTTTPGTTTPGTTTPGTTTPGTTTPGTTASQTPPSEQPAPEDDEPSTGTDGPDNIVGTVLDDGTPIDDVLEGFAGADTMNGGDGDDWLLGGSGDDSLTGGSGNDTLDGQYGNDTLLGGDGNDLIESGAGADRLTGGAGADEFHYSADDFYAQTRSLTAADADTLTDFTPGVDKLVFVAFASNSFGFSGLAAARTASGGLDAGAFLAGAGAAAATSTSHRLIYDTTAGVLRYDADGSGAGAAVVVVTLTGAPALGAADINVINSA